MTPHDCDECSDRRLWERCDCAKPSRIALLVPDLHLFHVYAPCRWNVRRRPIVIIVERRVDRLTVAWR